MECTGDLGQLMDSATECRAEDAKEGIIVFFADHRFDDKGRNSGYYGFIDAGTGSDVYFHLAQTFAHGSDNRDGSINWAPLLPTDRQIQRRFSDDLVKVGMKVRFWYAPSQPGEEKRRAMRVELPYNNWKGSVKHEVGKTTETARH